ncbi:hypothetical protein Nepgr_027104 [Nepenthes gracilis]|uniref:Homeobox-leucine zipper protein n=1 Tax=Nepenthes gracilis TaxID=150966 RepID=A0AAD3Y378_NEPGR|nr:hypothetical protein Nepgr_027104 [Nepenthes gracilis]
MHDHHHQDQVEDQTAVISRLYPGTHTQVAPQRGESSKPPPRRRRKRSKREGKAGGGVVGKNRKLMAEQVMMLEQSFWCQQKLETERKDRLAAELGLEPQQVAVWFQNRRARWKSKKLEEEYSILRSRHDTILVEKCTLEAELGKLKEELSDAKREIQRLSLQRSDNIFSNSPSSYVTMAAIDAQLLGEFAFKSFEDMFYATNDTHVSSMDQWVNLYT